MLEKKGYLAMKVIVDNNIILDVFQNREPYVEFSSVILRLIETKRIKGYVTANSITDIYYVLNRFLNNKQKVYSVLDTLLKLVEIIDVTAKDIQRALNPDAKDFEDELIIVCAEKSKIDVIITRNKKDFINSYVKAITPEEFLTEYFGE